MDKEHKTYLIICFLLITVIAYILNWNFEKMADTAITLVSIAVGVYIAAVSALLGSPYAKELKQETDKKKTGNWDLLEHLATDEDELRASILNDWRYRDFYIRYQEYVERWKPCES